MATIKTSDPNALSVIALDYFDALRSHSPATQAVYKTAITQLTAYLTEQGMPLVLTGIRREHVAAYLRDLEERTSASTALTRYRALSAFFHWAVEEDEITVSPMERMKPPRMVQQDRQAPTSTDLAKLIKACEGTTFYDRRDMAIISLLIDTGIRRQECASLKVGDFDWNLREIVVIAKGHKEHRSAYGMETAKAIRRYNAERKQHRDAESEWMWLGHTGRFTVSGLYEMVKKRAKLAGLPDAFSPHFMRHGFAHALKEQGASDETIMRLGGWSSDTVLRRYGKSLSEQRARDAYRTQRLSPRDKL